MISVEGVAKSFRGEPVLRGVDLAIPDRQTTFILGKSGQGKSVLLKHIIGLLAPDAGRVMVDGIDIGRAPARELDRVRRRFGMLFQAAALFDSMNVHENVAFPLVERGGLNRREIAARVEEALARVGLPGIGHKLPNELSGGMRKRVGLARALILDPDYLLYDEPTTGLDPLIRDQINRLIAETAARPITGIVISHDIPAALELADRIAFLHDGVIVEHGTPDDIRASAHPVVREFIEKGVSF